LFNYANPNIPDFIETNNIPPNNLISDEVATLGRVLFYDKKLSVNNTIACANCHKQEFAFGDTATVSKGFNEAFTTKHAPRLINLAHAPNS